MCEQRWLYFWRGQVGIVTCGFGSSTAKPFEGSRLEDKLLLASMIQKVFAVKEQGETL